MKKIILIFVCLLNICPPVYAREKNLYHLVEGKSLKIYLNEFRSDTEKISPETFKAILKGALTARKKENFKIVDTKEDSGIIVNCDVSAFKYLEKDPVDQVLGASALIADALVSQNYCQVQAGLTVIRTSDNRRLWHRKLIVSVTETDMPEPESIPKVLVECSKRFIFKCFGKPKK